MGRKLLLCLLFLALITVHSWATGEVEDDSVTTLKVFHYLDLADSVSADNFEALRLAFEEQHPDIKLEFDYLVNEPYHNKLQAMAVADELPDLLFLWPGKRTGSVTGSGKIKDLRPWLDAHRDEFASAAMLPQGPNGEMWEVPEQVTATHVMYTNRRLLDELGLSFPETLDELISQGNRIRNAGYIPIAMDNKDGWQMQSCFLSALVERTAGRKWLEASLVGDVSFSDPEFVNAVKVIKQLSDNDMFSPGINQAEYGRALTDFVTGKAVYFIDGGWRTSNLVGELSPDQYDDIEFHVFPTLPNEKGAAGSTATVAGTGFGMNAKLEGAKADAAWEWIWFFSGPEGSKIKQEQGWLPAYILPSNEDAPLLNRKLADFLAETPGGYVLDAVLSGESMGVLHPDLQEMMFGNISAQDVGDRYEKWIAANEETR